MTRRAKLLALVLVIVVAGGIAWSTMPRRATAGERRTAIVSARTPGGLADSLVLGSADLPGLWTRDPISTVQPSIEQIARCIGPASTRTARSEHMTSSVFGESHTLLLSRAVVRNAAPAVYAFAPTRLRTIRRCLARAAGTAATDVSLSQLAMPARLRDIFGFRVVGSLSSPTDHHRRAVFEAIDLAHGNAEAGVYAETFDPIHLTGLVNQTALILTRRLLTPPT